jgi:SAM-dependent methyltransferase
MGISYCGATTLWNARRRGVSFSQCLTVGHQFLFLHPTEVRALRRAFRTTASSPMATPLSTYRFGDYADEFLREFLGASTVTILDASSYEGADRIHDLNIPIPDDLKGQFDAVIESGSLEHIFNFPVAIANLASMLKVGGTLFISTPANNLMGHGFYQFSPELMFRVFSDENGFALRDVLLHEGVYPSVELSTNQQIYEVVDPAHVRSRVGLLSKGPVMMMVEAQKVRDVPMFATVPMQSDYEAMWKTAQAPKMLSASYRAMRTVFRALPLAIRARILGYRQKQLFSLANRSFYKKRSTAV